MNYTINCADMWQSCAELHWFILSLAGDRQVVGRQVGGWYSFACGKFFNKQAQASGGRCTLSCNNQLVAITQLCRVRACVFCGTSNMSTVSLPCVSRKLSTTRYCRIKKKLSNLEQFSFCFCICILWTVNRIYWQLFLLNK